jgi:hypothetical protein
MSNIANARRALTTRILNGEGKASSSERRAAFNNSGLAEPLRSLVDKVANHANLVTDNDIAAAQTLGLTEDQVFEIVVCAAVGLANRQYENALSALQSAAGKL